MFYKQLFVLFFQLKPWIPLAKTHLSVGRHWLVTLKDVSVLQTTIGMDNVVYPVTILINRLMLKEPSWQWSYASWIYNSLCNRCLSPL